MFGYVLGLASALAWGLSGLVGTRASRALGTTHSLAWGVVAGLVIVLGPAIVTVPRHTPSAGTIAWLLSGSVGSLVGLWTMLHSYRHGALSVVAPIIACQGAVIAALGVATGAPLRAATAVLLALATIGAAIVAAATRSDATRQRTAPVALVTSVASACSFGYGLFAAARASNAVGVFAPVAATRLIAVVSLTVPVLVAARGALPAWPKLRLGLVGGALDVAGMILFVASAATGSVAIAGVLSSQAAAVSTALGLLLLHERMTRSQKVGFVLILAAVSALAAGV